MKSIDSHIQPKHFLKGFLAVKEHPHDESVFVYKKGMPFKPDGPKSERNPAKTGIDKTAFVTNFYGFLREDGTLDPDTYEKRLEHEIEGPGNHVLKKLRAIELTKNEVINPNDFLNKDERRVFARYVASMYTRNQRSRKDHTKAIKETIDSGKNEGYSYAAIVQNIGSEEKKELDRYIDSISPDFDRTLGKITLPPGVLEKWKDEMETNETFPEAIFRGVAHVAPIILDMKWQFMITPNGHSLFTGDDPVTWNNLRNPNAVLLFPISSNAVFCGYNNQAMQESIFLQKNYEFVVGVRQVFAQACREIYFSKQAEWLVDFFNRR